MDILEQKRFSKCIESIATMLLLNRDCVVVFILIFAVLDLSPHRTIDEFILQKIILGLPVLLHSPTVDVCYSNASVTLTWPLFTSGVNGVGQGPVWGYVVKSLLNRIPPTSNWTEIRRIRETPAPQGNVFSFTDIVVNKDVSRKYRVDVIMENNQKPVEVSMPGKETNWISVLCVAPTVTLSDVKVTEGGRERGGELIFRVSWKSLGGVYRSEWGCTSITAQVIEIGCDDQCVQLRCDSLKTTPPPVVPPVDHIDLDLNRLFGGRDSIPSRLCVSGHLINNENLTGPPSEPISFATDLNSSSDITPSSESNSMAPVSPLELMLLSSLLTAVDDDRGSSSSGSKEAINPDEQCLTLLNRSEKWIRVGIVRRFRSFIPTFKLSVVQMQSLYTDSSKFSELPNIKIFDGQNIIDIRFLQPATRYQLILFTSYHRQLGGGGGGGGGGEAERSEKCSAAFWTWELPPKPLDAPRVVRVTRTTISLILKKPQKEEITTNDKDDFSGKYIDQITINPSATAEGNRSTYHPDKETRTVITSSIQSVTTDNYEHIATKTTGTMITAVMTKDKTTTEATTENMTKGATTTTMERRTLTESSETSERSSIGQSSRRPTETNYAHSNDDISVNTFSTSTNSTTTSRSSNISSSSSDTSATATSERSSIDESNRRSTETKYAHSNDDISINTFSTSTNSTTTTSRSSNISSSSSDSSATATSLLISRHRKREVDGNPRQEFLILVELFSLKLKSSSFESIVNNSTLTDLDSVVDRTNPNLPDFFRFEAGEASYYVAVGLREPAPWGEELTIGDGEFYGVSPNWFYNAPLRPGTKYRIWIGIQNSFDGTYRRRFTSLNSIETEGDALTEALLIAIAIAVSGFVLLCFLVAFTVFVYKREHRRHVNAVKGILMNTIPAASNEEQHMILSDHFTDHPTDPLYGHYPVCMCCASPPPSPPPPPPPTLIRFKCPTVMSQQTATMRNASETAHDAMLCDDSLYSIKSSNPMTVEDLCLSYRRCQSPIVEEFSLLPFGYIDPVICASLSRNSPLNRSFKCLPYDKNLVSLSDTTYINASIIRTIAFYPYVVTQAPLPNTLVSFWQMVWEMNCATLITLDNVSVAAGRCLFPTDDVINCHGPFTIRTTSLEKTAFYTRRCLRLGSIGSDRSSVVTHWQFTAWNGRGIPVHPIPFLNFVRRVQENRDCSRGVIVQCRLGTGRSGIFIALDLLLTQGRITGIVDVIKCVTLLRLERVKLVSTIRQYVFIYQCLVEAFDHPETRIQISSFYQTTQRLMKVTECSGRTGFEEELCYLDCDGRRRCTAIHLARNEIGIAVDSEMKDEKDLFVDSFKQRNAFIVIRKSFILTEENESFWNLIYQNTVRCVVTTDALMNVKKTFSRKVSLRNPSYRVSEHFILMRNSLRVYCNKAFLVHDLSLRPSHPTDNDSDLFLRLYELLKWPEEEESPTDTTSLLRFLAHIRRWTEAQQRPSATDRRKDVRHRQPIAFVRCNRRSTDDLDREATLSVVWNLLDQTEVESKVDIFSAVRYVRAQLNCDVISSHRQYEFLYMVLNNYLRIRSCCHCYGINITHNSMDDILVRNSSCNPPCHPSPKWHDVILSYHVTLDQPMIHHLATMTQRIRCNNKVRRTTDNECKRQPDATTGVHLKSPEDDHGSHELNRRDKERDEEEEKPEVKKKRQTEVGKESSQSLESEIIEEEKKRKKFVDSPSSSISTHIKQNRKEEAPVVDRCLSVVSDDNSSWIAADSLANVLVPTDCSAPDGSFTVTNQMTSRHSVISSQSVKNNSTVHPPPPPPPPPPHPPPSPSVTCSCEKSDRDIAIAGIESASCFREIEKYSVNPRSSLFSSAGRNIHSAADGSIAVTSQKRNEDFVNSACQSVHSSIKKDIICNHYPPPPPPPSSFPPPPPPPPPPPQACNESDSDVSVTGSHRISYIRENGGNDVNPSLLTSAAVQSISSMIISNWNNDPNGSNEAKSNDASVFIQRQMPHMSSDPKCLLIKGSVNENGLPKEMGKMTNRGKLNSFDSKVSDVLDTLEYDAVQTRTKQSGVSRKSTSENELLNLGFSAICCVAPPSPLPSDRGSLTKVRKQVLDAANADTVSVAKNEATNEANLNCEDDATIRLYKRRDTKAKPPSAAVDKVSENRCQKKNDTLSGLQSMERIQTGGVAMEAPIVISNGGPLNPEPAFSKVKTETAVPHETEIISSVNEMNKGKTDCHSDLKLFSSFQVKSEFVSDRWIRDPTDDNETGTSICRRNSGCDYGSTSSAWLSVEGSCQERQKRNGMTFPLSPLVSFQSTENASRSKCNDDEIKRRKERDERSEKEAEEERHWKKSTTSENYAMIEEEKEWKQELVEQKDPSSYHCKRDEERKTGSSAAIETTESGNDMKRPCGFESIDEGQNQNDVTDKLSDESFLRLSSSGLRGNDAAQSPDGEVNVDGVGDVDMRAIDYSFAVPVFSRSFPCQELMSSSTLDFENITAGVKDPSSVTTSSDHQWNTNRSVSTKLNDLNEERETSKANQTKTSLTRFPRNDSVAVHVATSFPTGEMEFSRSNNSSSSEQKRQVSFCSPDQLISLPQGTATMTIEEEWGVDKDRTVCQTGKMEGNELRDRRENKRKNANKNKEKTGRARPPVWSAVGSKDETSRSSLDWNRKEKHFRSCLQLGVVTPAHHITNIISPPPPPPPSPPLPPPPPSSSPLTSPGEEGELIESSTAISELNPTPTIDASNSSNAKSSKISSFLGRKMEAENLDRLNRSSDQCSSDFRHLSTTNEAEAKNDTGASERHLSNVHLPTDRKLTLDRFLHHHYERRTIPRGWSLSVNLDKDTRSTVKGSSNATSDAEPESRS